MALDMQQLIEREDCSDFMYIEILENAQGAADKMAATMDDTLAGAFDRLKSATDDVKITIGERLKPHLARFKGKIWIITEWDRSATTILFPSEY